MRGALVAAPVWAAALTCVSPAVARAQGPATPSGPTAPGVQVAAGVRGLSIDEEDYWWLTPGEALPFEAEGPGTLSLLVRCHVDPRSATRPAVATPGCAVRILGPSGEREAPVLEVVALPRPAPVRASVHPDDLLRPGAEAIVGGLLPPGRAAYRVELLQGPARGAAIGLRFLATAQRLVLGDEPGELDLDPPLPSGAPPLIAPTVAAAPTAAAVTSPDPPSSPAAPGAPAPSAPPPPAPPGPTAAAGPSPGAGADVRAELGLSVGAALDLAGAAGPVPSVGVSAGLPLGWVMVIARIDALSMQQRGSTPLPRAAPAELALRHDLFPASAGLRGGYALGRWRPEAELALGATWVRERLVALHHTAQRDETLVLMGLSGRVGLSLRLGPGALRADVLLRAHLAALRGASAATGALERMLELNVGYVVGLGARPARPRRR